MEPYRKAVLLIEDDPLLMSLYSSKLKNEGFIVMVASSGEEGLVAIELHQPCLVVLDMGLPGMSGLAVLERIRNNPETKDLAVIIVTSDAKKEDEIKARQIGVSDYIIKSDISLDALGEKVRECFDCK